MVRTPLPSEEYLTVIDNRGRQRVQYVEYIALDVRDEQVYVTTDGIIYATDSLAAKDFHDFIDDSSEKTEFFSKTARCYRSGSVPKTRFFDLLHWTH